MPELLHTEFCNDLDEMNPAPNYTAVDAQYPEYWKNFPDRKQNLLRTLKEKTRSTKSIYFNQPYLMLLVSQA